MKKFLRILLGSVWIMVGSMTFALWGTEDFPYDLQTTTPVTQSDNPTDLGQVIKQDAVTPSNGILQTLTKFFRVSGTSYNQDNTGSPALQYIKWILNIVLGLVSFASLVLVIYAFYLIFFSKDEEGFKKAKKILIGVAMALGILGVSRFIVSYFFSVFFKIA